MEAMQARRARALFYAFLACLFGFGIALICVGAKNITATSEYRHWLHSSDTSAPILAVASGCGILCLTVLGFVSALKEHSTGLIAFAVILGAFTIMEIVGGALAAAGSAKSTTSLQQRMEDSMQSYPTKDEYKRAWDNIQLDYGRVVLEKSAEAAGSQLGGATGHTEVGAQLMRCCGTVDSRQWKEVYPGKAPPVSCCPERDVKQKEGRRATAPPGFCQPRDQIFRQGCYRPLLSYVKTAMDEVAYVSLIFSFFQICGIALASYLAYAIKRERDVKEAVVEVLKEGGESAISRRTNKEISIATITAPTS